MGLGIYCRAVRDNISSDLPLLEKIGTEFAEASGLRNFFGVNGGANWIAFQFHPAAEPVELIIDGAILSLSAKTSGVGPGYHRLVIDFVDLLTSRLSLAWEGSDNGELDETGYFQHRAFHRLQREMQRFLRKLCGTLTERESSSGFMLNMPLGIDPDYTGVATPMGEWPLETLRIAATDDHALSDLSPDFFPWWDEELTPTALRNCAVTTMWLDIHWRPPQAMDEKRQIQSVLETLKQARAAEPALPIPMQELLELEAILAGEPTDPSRPGIGYRRRICRRDLTGGWSLRIEGYFYSNDEEGKLSFWFGDREAWFTSFSIEPAREAVLSDVMNGDEKTDHLIEHYGNVGRATTKWKKDGYFLMSCVFQGFGTSAVLTLIFPDDSYRGWAEGVFRSVRCEQRRSEEA